MPAGWGQAPFLDEGTSSLDAKRVQPLPPSHSGPLRPGVGFRAEAIALGDTATGVVGRAVWTDDRALSTHINREVAHYTGQTELMEAIHNERTPATLVT